MLPTLDVVLSDWRRDLKSHLLGRDLICPVCGDPIYSHGGFDLHESLITREYVSKWPERWKKLIHCELNCILVHRWECHDFRPSPEETWKRHCSIYTVSVMTEWALSLPFKSNPLSGFIQCTMMEIA